MRPLLKAGLRQVWRDGGTLQIGLTPGRSLMLNGMDPGVERFLAALDGTRDVRQLVAYAEGLGLAARQAGGLLDMLTRAGFLDDAAYDTAPLKGLAGAELDRLRPDLASLALGYLVPGGAVRAMARRRSAVVAVYGCGRVGASVAHILASAGVGCIVPHDTERMRAGDAAPAGLRAELIARAAGLTADLRTRRQDAVRDLLHAVSPSIRTTLPANRQHPDLAVLAPTNRWPHATADRLHAAGVPHLPAQIHETSATLGPFVQPGRSSCLRCRDLHRAARDPGWPRVLAQLVQHPDPEDAPCDGVLATQLAVQAAMHALAYIEGDPPPSVGHSIEIALPYGEQTRRECPAHPECACSSDN